MATLDFSREVAEAISNNPFLEDEEGQSHDEGRSDAHPEAGVVEPLPDDAISLSASDTATSSEMDSANIETIEPVTASYDDTAESTKEYSGDYPTSRNNDQP